MQNSMGIFTFLGFGPKDLFWAYLVQKFKFVCSGKNLRDMQNTLVLFFPSVLGWKHPFWASLVQKMEIVSFSWNVIASLTQIWRTQRWCSSLFFNGTPFYGKFVSKNQNCVLKLKYGTQTNLIVMFFFFCFRAFL